jgi:hypothetical protein
MGAITKEGRRMVGKAVTPSGAHIGGHTRLKLVLWQQLFPAAGRRLKPNVSTDHARSVQLHASRQEDHLPEVRSAVMLRTRPMTAMASTGRGTKAVYHKEGIDPCIGYAHYCIGLCQLRRERPAPRLRGVVGKGVHRPHPAPHAPIDQYWHNRTGEDACPGRRDRGLP